MGYGYLTPKPAAGPGRTIDVIVDSASTYPVAFPYRGEDSEIGGHFDSRDAEPNIAEEAILMWMNGDMDGVESRSINLIMSLPTTQESRGVT